MGDSDGGTAEPAAPSTATASTTPSTTPSQTPTASESAASATPTTGPTADAMTGFLASYLRTVVADPGAAFDELTPGYQQRSGGERGYRNFWGPVTRARLVSAQADPASLVIQYTYRYTRDGTRGTQETHRMQLEYTDGRYLIADQT